MRCNKDGSLDKTFGVNGVDTIEGNNVYAIVQPDDKIVVVSSVKDVSDSGKN